MMTLWREFFMVNQTIVLFVYGQVFFVLGLVIAVQSWRHSRLALARNLTWLAVVGVINSAISAFYYLGVVVQMYMRSTTEADLPAEAAPINLSAPITVTLAASVLVTVLLGIWPTLLVNLTALGIFG